MVKVPLLVHKAKFLSLPFLALRWVLTVISILIRSYGVAVIIKKEALVAEEDEEDDPATDTFQIRKQYCIGWGVCVIWRSEYYGMKASNKAEMKKFSSGSESIAAVQLTIEECPATNYLNDRTGKKLYEEMKEQVSLG